MERGVVLRGGYIRHLFFFGGWVFNVKKWERPHRVQFSLPHFRDMKVPVDSIVVHT